MPVLSPSTQRRRPRPRLQGPKVPNLAGYTEPDGYFSEGLTCAGGGERLPAQRP